MPYIGVSTSRDVPEEKREVVLKALSAAVAKSTGKPERYVMAVLTRADVVFGGEVEDAAFVDVRGIGGLTQDVNNDMTQRICSLLEAVLGIEPGSVYITFTDVPATNWGWNNTTFA